MKDQATESVELSNFCLRDFRAQSRAQAVGHEANEPCDDGSARVTCAAPPVCRDETRPIKPYQRELRTNGCLAKLASSKWHARTGTLLTKAA